jgi:hypothetical protein
MEKISVTLMLRPSLIIWRMEGTHSGVAGIFTSTLGWSIRVCSDRAAAMVPSVSWANAGATSTETKPSPPSELSYTGRSTARAALMSSTTRSQ